MLVCCFLVSCVDLILNLCFFFVLPCGFDLFLLIGCGFVCGD